MSGLRLGRLRLSLWPFIIIAPGEFLGAVLVRRLNAGDTAGRPFLVDALLGVGIGLVVAAVCVITARRLINRSRSLRWRSVGMAIGIYVGAALLSGIVMILLLVDRSPTGQPASLTVLYLVSRPVNILVLAVVVQQARDGMSATRAVDAITQDRLLLARNANEMIEAAERDLRVESLRMFAFQVAGPLRRIVRDGPDLSDAELADRLDGFIEQHLRPMAHLLHPVSVRLGLLPAIRSVNPQVTVDVTPTVERMDSDGVLLDDDVRLQLYRWIRSGLLDQGTARIAFVVRGRELEVSLHPSGPATLDAVQLAAGLSPRGPGRVAVPLRGQVMEVPLLTSPPAGAPPPRIRYQVRDLMTVPLPGRLAIVALLSLGAAPFQFIVYRWSPSVATLVATLSCAFAPILVTALLDRLPPPGRSIRGAWRVVGEWLAIAGVAAAALAGFGVAFGLLPVDANEWLLTFVRMSYRFAVPGLLVTVTYGLAVESQRRLQLAQEALQREEQRRIKILNASHQLDRDVAEALHRTVQGRLAAAVVMLRLGQREEAWTQVVDMAAVEVPWLLDRMGDSRMARVLVPEQPIGLAVIQLDEPPVDSEAFSLLVRAVGEIAVNARRHGHASALVISTEIADGRWMLVCDDDGVGMEESSEPGLGSRLLDDTVAVIGGSWRMESLPRGCRVVIEAPLVSREPVRASSAE